MINTKHSGLMGIILAMAVSLTFDSMVCAATVELNCGQPANQHLSVDLAKSTVLSQTKNDPKQYGPGSGYRGVWQPVSTYSAPVKITPRLFDWVVYAGTQPLYYDLDRTTGILYTRWPVGPYWNSVHVQCVVGTMSFPSAKF